MKYTIIIEKGNNSYGAYVPDIPGLVIVAKSKKVALQLVKEAVRQHLDNLGNEGQPLPLARSESGYIEIENDE